MYFLNTAVVFKYVTITAFTKTYCFINHCLDPPRNRVGYKVTRYCCSFYISENVQRELQSRKYSAERQTIRARSFQFQLILPVFIGSTGSQADSPRANSLFVEKVFTF